LLLSSFKLPIAIYSRTLIFVLCFYIISLLFLSPSDYSLFIPLFLHYFPVCFFLLPTSLLCAHPFVFTYTIHALYIFFRSPALHSQFRVPKRASDSLHFSGLCCTVWVTIAIAYLIVIQATGDLRAFLRRLLPLPLHRLLSLLFCFLSSISSSSYLKVVYSPLFCIPPPSLLSPLSSPLCPIPSLLSSPVRLLASRLLRLRISSGRGGRGRGRGRGGRGSRGRRSEGDDRDCDCESGGGGKVEG
jgi:hypothetical protein